MNEFESHRPLLFSIAYRMLGTAMEAEDMVQEAYLRWRKVDPSTVSNPKAFLAKTVTRLSIDYLKTARVQREQYVGPWLPEPLVTQTNSADMVDLADSLSFAFLIMLEALTPTERAVFLLREVFDYDFDAISTMVDKSSSNCRQILRRARQRIAKKQPRFDTNSAERDRILTTFMQTCITGDLDGILTVLGEDIVMWSDGGGKVVAARKPVRGPQKVAAFLLGLQKLATATTTTEFAIINHQPAFVIRQDGFVDAIFLTHIEDGAVQHVYAVRNPDKLAHVNAHLG